MVSRKGLLVNPDSTAYKVLAALAPYNLREVSSGKYKCNSPFKAGSDSGSFNLNITDDEHGVFHYFVDGDGGTLYELAERLNIEVPETVITTLEQYAQKQGVPAQVFRAAGWQECKKWTQAGEFPALSFPTATGTRWRVLGEYVPEKPKFINEKGYKNCWYGLERAIRRATLNNQPLIICNGEPSVLVADFYHIGATCFTGGEGKNITVAQIDELRSKWSGEVWVALDCDKAGRKGSENYYNALNRHYPHLRILDFAKERKGYDLANFCNEHGTNTYNALAALPDLDVQQQPKAVQSHILPELILTPHQAQREREAIAKIRQEAWWQGFHAGLSASAKEFWMGLGATETYINSLQLGYCDDADALTIPYFDAEGRLMNIEYRPTIDPQQATYQSTLPSLLRVKGGDDDTPILLVPDSLQAIIAAQYRHVAPYPLYAMPHMQMDGQSMEALQGREAVVVATEDDSRIHPLKGKAKILQLPMNFSEMVKLGMTSTQIRQYIRQAS